MKKLSLVLSLVLALAMLVPMTSLAEEMTDVGTPRAQTLICEPDADTNPVPGQFNPYMTGTPASWGMHQIMWVDGMWDRNTITGDLNCTIAAEPAEHNEDYTEWTVKIRDNLKWSDGEALDANDVAFTFNKIYNTENMGDHTYYNTIFAGECELVDDYTVKFFCKEPFTRLQTTLGVNTWGCGFRVIPEHVYSQVEDILSFTDPEPLAAGPYKLKEYDPLGTWILYEKREDWANTPTGILYGEPVPQYVLYRVFGSGESRVMAAINNEVDVMNEHSYENFKLMIAQSDTVRGWYPDFPYANTDDACSKGVWFNCGIEPFNDVDVRWALTLCCNWIEVDENIFDGIGRMSPLSVIALTAQLDRYYAPLQDWLTNEFMIFDGTYNPWNPNFSYELRDALIEDYGYDLADLTDEELKIMFGVGYWKTDVEKATEVLEAKEDFELKDGKWYYKGEPWVIQVHEHPEEASTQAARSAKAIADQWKKFGITVEETTLTNADVGNRANMGDFEVNDNWSTCCGYWGDFYGNISGWNLDVYHYEIGELGSGIGIYRFDKADPELAHEISLLVQKAATLDPNGEEIIQTLTEFVKLTAQAHINIDVHAGTKIVPINEAYWTGFQTSENPYEGPWWWWNCFRYTLPKLTPVER